MEKASEAKLFVRGGEFDVVVYAAGLTSVDRCEADEPLAELLNATVPAQIAGEVGGPPTRFIYVSTDHLWHGSKSMVCETEPLHPLNAYARSKAKGELWVSQADPQALILRTNFFGNGRPWRQSLSDWMLQRLKSGDELPAFADAYFTPIAVPLLCLTMIAAVAANLRGTFHVCGAERLSKYDFGKRLADWCGLPAERVHARRIAEAGLLAPRPADLSLSTGKIEAALGRAMPNISDSLAAVFGPRATLAQPFVSSRRQKRTAQ